MRTSMPRRLRPAIGELVVESARAGYLAARELGIRADEPPELSLEDLDVPAGDFAVDLAAAVADSLDRAAMPENPTARSLLPSRGSTDRGAPILPSTACANSPMLPTPTPSARPFGSKGMKTRSGPSGIGPPPATPPE